MPRLPDAAWLDLAPDWVCEVLSPQTARTDRAEKLPIYATAGVSHAWLIDPIQHTLEGFSLHQGQWLLIGVLEGEAEVALAPFEAVTFDLDALWAD